MSIETKNGERKFPHGRHFCVAFLDVIKEPGEKKITGRPYYLDHVLVTNKKTGERQGKNRVMAKQALSRLKMALSAILELRYSEMDFEKAEQIETEILQARQWTSSWLYALTASIVAGCPVGLTKEEYVKAFRRLIIAHYHAVIPKMIRIKEILAERRVKGKDLNLAEGIKGLLPLAKLVRR